MKYTETNPMWTLREALQLMPKFEAIAKIMGYHVALGGSVMYNGMSIKDLDIIVYPHTDVDLERPIPDQLVQMFIYNKLLVSANLTPCSPWSKDCPNARYVNCGMTRDNHRIDFIFV